MTQFLDIETVTKATEDSSRKTTKKTVVLIDDSRTWRVILKGILGQRYHYESYASWSEAFQRLYSGDIDLLLLDVNMPGIDGPTIAKMQSQHQCKIMFFSSEDRSYLERLQDSCGVAGFLQKSALPFQIRGAVDQILK